MARQSAIIKGLVQDAKRGDADAKAALEQVAGSTKPEAADLAAQARAAGFSPRTSPPPPADDADDT